MNRFSALLISLLLLSSCSDGTWWGATKKIDAKGERLKVIHNSSEAVVDDSIKNTIFRIPAPVRNSGWYKSSGITSSMVNNLELKMPLEKTNLFSVTGGKDFVIGGTPIIAENKLFAIGADGIITAYEIQTKQVLWQNEFFPTATKKGFFSLFSGVFLNGGLLYSDGIIYATAGLAEIIAIDATEGRLLWSAKLSSPSRSTPLKTNNNILFVQTADNKTFALEAMTGKILWNHIGIGEEISSLRTSAPIASDDTVIIQYTSGELYALSVSTGEELWTENLASPIDAIVTDSHLHTVITSPTIDGNTVMAYGHDGVMGVFDIKTGKPFWKKQLGIDKQFWVAGELVYAVTIDSDLIAIHKKDGKVKWSVDLSELSPEGIKTSWSSPIVGDSKVIILNSQGSMFFFDMNTGANLETIAIEQDTYLAPIIANGELFTISNSGTIGMY